MLTKLFVVAMSAIFIENIVLVKLIGDFKVPSEVKRMSGSVYMGTALALIMVLSTALNYLMNKYLLTRFNLQYLKIFGLLLMIVLVMKATEIVLFKFLPTFYDKLKDYFFYVLTNCAVLGVAFITLDKGQGLVESILYSFFSAVGFTIALILINSVNEKLQFCDVPKAFQGAPILFVAIALIALAFMGFSGMKFAI